MKTGYGFKIVAYKPLLEVAGKRRAVFVYETEEKAKQAVIEINNMRVGFDSLDVKMLI